MLKTLNKAKLARGIGMSLLVTAIFLLILGILPTSGGSRLPAWITQVKPSGSRLTHGLMRGELTPVDIHEGTRRLPMAMAEFSQRLKADLGKNPEWHDTTSSQSNPTWSRGNGSETETLWAMQEGDEVVVHTHWAHKPSWLENAQAKIRAFFGAK